MDRIDAFDICLEKIKQTATKTIWASYLHRWKRGTIKETTVLSLLDKHGFKKIAEEQWEEVDEQYIVEKLNKYQFIRYNIIKRKFEIKKVKAPSKEEAQKEAGRRYTLIDSNQSIMDYVNKMI